MGRVREVDILFENVGERKVTVFAEPNPDIHNLEPGEKLLLKDVSEERPDGSVVILLRNKGDQIEVVLFSDNYDISAVHTR